MTERPPMSMEKHALRVSRCVDGVGPSWTFRKLPTGKVQIQVHESNGMRGRGPLFAELELSPDMWAAIGARPAPADWPEDT